MKLLVLVLMLATSLGFAQSAPARKSPGKTRAKTAAPAEQAAKWPIGSLAVEGNRNYASEQVLRVAGLKVGQLAGKEEFDAASDRLEASGVFDKVGYKFGPAADGKSYAASFTVIEAGPLLPIRFSRLGAPDADLEAMLRSRDPFFTGKAPATRIVVDRYAKWIGEYLASKGLDSKVVTDVTTRPEGMCLIFESAKSLPAVAQVTFQGNQAIPQNTLREAVAGPAVGSAYTEERFRAILENSVRPLYEARGLIRVAFPKIATERAKEVEGLNVTVTVAEGEVYALLGLNGAGKSSLVKGATRMADTKCAPNQLTAAEVEGYDADTGKLVADAMGH
jgi:outer membrane protein assembly factor BamA